MSREKKLKIKAVLIGWFVDIAGSFIATAIINVIFAFIAAASQGPTPSNPAMIDRLSSLAVFLHIVIWFCFVALGGFLITQIAKTTELRYPFIIGVVALQKKGLINFK